jgi:ATP-dependent Zn protease
MDSKSILGSKQRLSKREATAYHEAGHAVMHCYLRVPFKKTTIRSTGDYLGMVAGYRLGKVTIGGLRLGRLAARTRERVENMIMILIAGGIAEHVATGRRENAGSAADRSAITDFLTRAYSSERQISTYWAWLESLTKDIVSEILWKAVEQTAQGLLERETLPTHEVCSILETAQKPPELGSDGRRGGHQSSILRPEPRDSPIVTRAELESPSSGSN